jgi:hypothetical protein
MNREDLPLLIRKHIQERHVPDLMMHGLRTGLLIGSLFFEGPGWQEHILDLVNRILAERVGGA